jgi:hypothetical protein
MSAATSTIVALSLGAGGAVTNYLAGRSQGRAAEKAAEQQVQGVREARAYAEPKYAEAQRIAREQNDRAQAILAEQYQRGQATLAPYAGGGAQGLTALTALLGLPSAPSAAAPAPSGAPRAAGAPVAGSAPSGVGTTTLANGIPLSLLASLTTKQIAEGNRALGGGLLGMAGTQGQPAPATQSSYVSLRAPTGDVRPVPADQVDFYLARGATRV